MLFDFEERLKRCQNIWLVLMQSFIFYTKKKYFSKPVKTMLVMHLFFPPFLLTECRNASSIKVLILFNEQNFKKQNKKQTNLYLPSSTHYLGRKFRDFPTGYFWQLLFNCFLSSTAYNCVLPNHLEKKKKKICAIKEDHALDIVVVSFLIKTFFFCSG